jgi:crotonobetainyl-CoA:carnitine CoA-transferase CaiB-like acyl-CoA transferase
MPETAPEALGALHDVRVLEFAQALAVPSCGALLADMGADVVKIEPPRGDTYRLQNRAPVPGEGRDFAICNRGKRSLCLDLGRPESRDVVDRLVAGADVVLVSFKVTDLVRYGLDYERLRTVKPRLVYLENTPYGRHGPLGDEGGYDVVAMGLSGLSSVVATPLGDTPRFVRPAFADIGTGVYSALATPRSSTRPSASRRRWCIATRISTAPGGRRSTPSSRGCARRAPGSTRSRPPTIGTSTSRRSATCISATTGPATASSRWAA